MSSISINPAALQEIESLGLDKHSHPFGSPFFFGVYMRESNCNKGLVHTYEACRVISRYANASLSFRIWNAIKWLFGLSVWQKGIKSCVKVLKETGRAKSIKEIEAIFLKAYEAAQKGTERVPFKKPKGPCQPPRLA